MYSAFVHSEWRLFVQYQYILKFPVLNRHLEIDSLHQYARHFLSDTFSRHYILLGSGMYTCTLYKYITNSLLILPHDNNECLLTDFMLTTIQQRIYSYNI